MHDCSCRGNARLPRSSCPNIIILAALHDIAHTTAPPTSRSRISKIWSKMDKSWASGRQRTGACFRAPKRFLAPCCLCCRRKSNQIRGRSGDLTSLLHWSVSSAGPLSNQDDCHGLSAASISTFGLLHFLLQFSGLFLFLCVTGRPLYFRLRPFAVLILFFGVVNPFLVI